MASVHAWNHYGNWLVFVSLLQAAFLVHGISNLFKGVDVNFWLTLVPVIVTAFLFFILLLKVAYEEFYVKGLKSEEVEVFVIREKPTRFVVFILAILAIFVSAIVIIVKQNSQIGDLKMQGENPSSIPTNSVAQSSSPKPMPDKYQFIVSVLPSIETNNLPLIYSKIDTFSIYSCNWSAGTNRGYCLGGRTGNVASASDLTVNFDITNPNSMDVRISEIKIKVERFDNISVRIEPLAGMQTKRNYVCQLSTNTDFYKCEWLNGKPDQYIKLAKNELEHFCINTQTQTAGFYQVSFWVQYVIGSETKTEKAGVANLYFGNF